jgi:tRNA-modifying protein YgfZ
MTGGYKALAEAEAWLDLSARSRIAIRGRDRVRLLHNLTTAHVKALQPGQSCYAFLLNPRGHIQMDLDLYCYPDSFLAEAEPGQDSRLIGLIRRYIVSDQVELEDVRESITSIGVEGPAAEAVVPGIEEFPVARCSVTGQPGYRIYCAAARRGEMIAILEAAGVHQASEEDARVMRIENGRPRYGEDFFDTSLPQETGQMRAVSFTKGCYLGQEVVERIRTQGHVNRRLVRLEVDGTTPPPAGTKLPWREGEAEVTSAVYSPRLGRCAALAWTRVVA